MTIDMGFDFGFGFAWGVATAIMVLSFIWWIAKGCYAILPKKKYERISRDYCSNPFKDGRRR